MTIEIIANKTNKTLQKENTIHSMDRVITPI